MIGKFYPFLVYTAVNVGAGFAPVANVRSTNVATELSNDLDWWFAYDN